MEYCVSNVYVCVCVIFEGKEGMERESLRKWCVLIHHCSVILVLVHG